MLSAGEPRSIEELTIPAILVGIFFARQMCAGYTLGPNEERRNSGWDLRGICW